jgi:subtilisin family serine protease
MFSTGVAPGVTLGAYRVLGCSVDISATDVMAAAIYKAADDGADVINLSLGGGRMCSFLLSYSLWIYLLVYCSYS